MSNTLLSTVIDRVYTELEEKSTSTLYTKSRIISLANEYQDQICRGSVSSLIEDKDYKSGDLRFLKKIIGINLVPSTTLNNNITVGDSSITLNSAAGLQSSGYVCINENIYKYTSIVGSVLQGVQGTILNVPLGAVVKQVYKLPSDYNNYLGLQYVKSTNTTVTSPASNNFLTFWDQRGERPMERHRTIFGDSFSTDQEYIYINGYNGSSDAFLFYYYCKPTTLVNDTDAFTIPDNYPERIIASLIAGHMLYVTEEPQKGSQLLSKGYRALSELYGTYGSKGNQFRKKVVVKPMNNLNTPFTKTMIRQG